MQGVSDHCLGFGLYTWLFSLFISSRFGHNKDTLFVNLRAIGNYRCTK